MQIINGSLIANKILEELKQEVARLSFRPLFCDLLVGDDQVSKSYVNIKAKRAQEIGLEFKLIQLPVDVTTGQLILELTEVQKNLQLAGLIVQLPLPVSLDKALILNAIDSKVDVDYLSDVNGKLFYEGKNKLTPPTAAAVMTLLDSLELDLKLMNILVVGQGDLVGRPVTFLLRERQLKVTTADTSTNDLQSLTKKADIIISGTGQAKLIKGDMIKPGAILIDCGTTESGGGIVGDIDSDSVSSIAGFVSPVPGGVGPVTVARLLYNVVAVAKEINSNV